MYVYRYINWLCIIITVSLSQTLHCVCRIAEVLIALQQVGNVKYIGWIMNFYCKTHLVKDLQSEAKEMEDELVRWNDEVTNARMKFYELNYYTTRQLLVLRRELGKVKTTGCDTQSCQVMAMLESISKELNPMIVTKAVNLVTTRALGETRTSKSDQGNRAKDTPSPSVSGNMCQTILSPATEMDTVELDTEITSEPSILKKSLPLVSLESLTEKQREHFFNITYYGYSKFIALKAIEVIGDGDCNDIENWIKENADKYEQTSQDVQEEGLDDTEDSENYDDVSSGAESEMYTENFEHSQSKYLTQLLLW